MCTAPNELPIACANSHTMNGLSGLAAMNSSIFSAGVYICEWMSVDSGKRLSNVMPS